MSQASLIGMAVGNYRIVDVLGEGGMGTVYRAIHPELDRTVAIKVLALNLAHSDDIVRRFRVEARAVNKIKHANVVDIQDFGTLPDGRPYYVMEYLAGESLGSYLTRVGILPARDCIVIMLPITEALEAAHSAGVVHRDLKPDNIFLVARPNASPTPKLLDFGIAKVLTETVAGADRNRTQAGQLMGTPLYMSPEQAAGRVDALGTASDIYSLGVILYQMLSGQPPFDSQAFGELLMMHMSSPPPPLSSKVNVLPQLEDLVMRMLAKSPNERPAHGGHVRRELAALADVLSLSASGPLARAPNAPTVMADSNPSIPVQRDSRPPVSRPPGGTYPSGVAGEVHGASTLQMRSKTPLFVALAVATVAAAGIAVALVSTSGNNSEAPAATAPAATTTPADAALAQRTPPPEPDAAIDVPRDAPMDAPAIPESELERRLRVLKDLYDAGKMDQTEYDTRRKRILEE